MSISSESLPPDRAGSPSSLIVTFAGCYLRQIGGWVAVADLIRLLALVGVPEPAVRQSVLRLKSRGFLTAERRGGSAGYALTAAGREDLVPGDRRIFRYGQADLADGWVLAVFSVPEDRRHHRHQLRSQLGWLGFGAVGAGVWAAPAALAEPARELLVQDGLDRYVTWFHARALDPVDVAAWWDLVSLREQYQAFLDRWGPAAQCDDGDRTAVTEPIDSPVSVTQTAGSDAFAGYLQLVDSWRLFPRIDPGLPSELLPSDWPGPVAWQVFSRLRTRWADVGLQYLAAVTGRPADPAVAGPRAFTA
jgi:phenylacetic acid degradation operon negative regulatory protein